MGKEWTNNEGTILNDFPQWVKSIGYHGDVRHHKWVDNYSKLRTVGGFQHPGEAKVELDYKFEMKYFIIIL